ncbi:MAG: hypothetical protein ACTSRP_00980 [Candidatus Helarchaeota archaeon]
MSIDGSQCIFGDYNTGEIFYLCFESKIRFEYENDTDNDGLCDGDEYFIYMTNLCNNDTDNDGYSDGWEIANGFNPLDPNDDFTAPKYFNEKLLLNTPQYTPKQHYQFNLTIIDNLAIDKVIFEWNGKNHTVNTHNGDEYYFDLYDLGAGTYQYRWYFNDTSNNWNFTLPKIYEIKKATPSIELFLNGTTDNITTKWHGIVNITITLSISAEIKLYINGSLNKTGIAPLISNIRFSEKAVYNITGIFSGNSNYSRVSITRWVFVDSQCPKYANETLNKPSGFIYVPRQFYQFNLSITDNLELGTVFFEWNGKNYTVNTHNCDEYYFDLYDLGAGTYQYRWYFNDTSNNWNSTSLKSYEINKSSVGLEVLLNNSNSNFQINRTQSCNITIILSVNDTIYFYLNNTQVCSANRIIVNISTYYKIGTYNITGYYPGNQNYSKKVIMHWLTVIDVECPQYQNLQVNPTNATYLPHQIYQFNCTWTDDVKIQNVIFEFNNINYTVISNNSAEYFYTLTDLPANPDGYLYRWFAYDTSGNSRKTEYQLYIINKKMPNIQFSIAPINSTNDNITINQYEYVNITVNILESNNLGNLTLYIEEIGITSKINTTKIINISQFRQAGIFNITYWLEETCNLTAKTETKWLTVNDIESPILIHYQNLTYLNCTQLEYQYKGLKIAINVSDNLMVYNVLICENSTGTFINRSIKNHVGDLYSIELDISMLNYGDTFGYYFYANDSSNLWGKLDNSGKFFTLKVHDFIPPGACNIYFKIFNLSYFVLETTQFTLLGGNDFGGSGIAHYKYKIDNDNWYFGDSFDLSGVPNGLHTISFCAVDKAGNSGPIQNITIFLLANNADYDGDGLTNYQEIFIYRTNVFSPDTDGDGFTDEEEVNAKTDPLNPYINPLTIKYLIIIILFAVLLIAISVIAYFYVYKTLRQDRRKEREKSRISFENQIDDKVKTKNNKQNVFKKYSIHVENSSAKELERIDSVDKEKRDIVKLEADKFDIAFEKTLELKETDFLIINETISVDSKEEGSNIIEVIEEKSCDKYESKVAPHKKDTFNNNEVKNGRSLLEKKKKLEFTENKQNIDRVEISNTENRIKQKKKIYRSSSLNFEINKILKNETIKKSRIYKDAIKKPHKPKDHKIRVRHSLNEIYSNKYREKRSKRHKREKDKILKKKKKKKKKLNPYVILDLNELKIKIIIPKFELSMDQGDIDNNCKYIVQLNNNSIAFEIDSEEIDRKIYDESIQITCNEPIDNFSIEYQLHNQERIFEYKHRTSEFYLFNTNTLKLICPTEKPFFLYNLDSIWILLKEGYEILEKEIIERDTGLLFWNKYKLYKINLVYINSFTIVGDSKQIKVYVENIDEVSIINNPIIDDFYDLCPLYTDKELKIKLNKEISNNAEFKVLISERSKPIRSLKVKEIDVNINGEGIIIIKCPEDLPEKYGIFQLNIYHFKYLIKRFIFRWAPYIKIFTPEKLLIPKDGRYEPISLKIEINEYFNIYHCTNNYKKEIFNNLAIYQINIPSDQLSFSCYFSEKDSPLKLPIKITFPKLQWKLSNEKNWISEPIILNTNKMNSYTPTFLELNTNIKCYNFKFKGILKDDFETFQELNFNRNKTDESIYNINLNYFIDVIRSKGITDLVLDVEYGYTWNDKKIRDSMGKNTRAKDIFTIAIFKGKIPINKTKSYNHDHKIFKIQKELEISIHLLILIINKIGQKFSTYKKECDELMKYFDKTDLEQFDSSFFILESLKIIKDVLEHKDIVRKSNNTVRQLLTNFINSYLNSEIIE